MKTYTNPFRNIILLLFSCFAIIATGCKKDDNGTETQEKTPLWVFNTEADPFQSKACLKGDSIVFYASDDNVDMGLFLYCVNRNSGNLIWKTLDSLAFGAKSPLIYNNLIVAGGLNPHAFYLKNGNRAWMYVDPDIYPAQHAMYNNPLVIGDAVYFAGMLGVSKHGCGSGARIWKTENGVLWSNLRSSRMVYKNGKLYFGNGGPYTVTSFYEISGQIEWEKTFESPFANFPAVTDNEIFIGVQSSDIETKTLRCLNLSDQSDKWGVKLGTIWSDIVVEADRVYAIGMTTIHCRSTVDGSPIWHYEMIAGATSEPLIAGDKLIIGYGKGLICFKAATGEKIWEYNSVKDGVTHSFSSPTLDGDRFYVSCSDGNVYCFSVD